MWLQLSFFLYILESIVSFSAYEELVTSWWLHSFCLLTYHTQDLCTRKVPSSSPSHLAVARFQKFLPQRKDTKKLQIQSLPTVQHFSGGSSGECWTGFRSRECLFPIYFGGYKRKLHSLNSCEFMKSCSLNPNLVISMVWSFNWKHDKQFHAQVQSVCISGNTPFLM